MGVFALIGVLSMALSSAVTIVLPLCLAKWVSPVWLWLYAGYGAFTILFLGIASKVAPESKDGDS